jgi:valyl-tRNA synthetase
LLRDAGVQQSRDDVARLIDIVTAARSLKAQFKISPAQPVPLAVRADYSGGAQMLERIAEDAQHLARLQSWTVVGADDEVPRECGTEIVRGVEVMLPLAGLVDIAAETKRLQKEHDKLTRDIASLEKKLANQGFVTKAPPEVVAKEKDRLGQLRIDADKLQATLQRLG